MKKPQKQTPVFFALFLLLTFTLLSGCRDEQPLSLDASSSFYVKDINREVLEQIDPEILQLIQKDLILKGRDQDAKNLFNTYDKVSGNLLPVAVKENSSKTQSEGRTASAYTVLLDGHIQNVGWVYNTPLGGTVGTEFQNKRLEAFRVNLNPYSSSGASTIQYEAHCAGIGWQGMKNPGDVAGTVFQNRAIEAIRFNANPSFATQVMYRAQVANVGWMPWVSNNQIAGTTGQHKNLEAFQLTMLVY